MFSASKMIRRFCRQVQAWDLRRELEKAGMERAVNRPMMAITIMISASVKPLLPLGFPACMISLHNLIFY
jgi:hypothetical protein